ncbi:hypothetical protein [Candidatus Phytoplasma solani]|uniref:hypothetical protein n=1 Tax=Candidatus Phytoplasma solani TaxID=69896 RepID=UPI0035901E75
MSPIPQGIKVYKKITNKISHIISNFKKINKKTIMCYNKVEANISFIKLVSEYVTKYTTKNENKNNQKELKEQLNNKDEKQESLLDKLIKIFRKKKDVYLFLVVIVDKYRLKKKLNIILKI